MKKLHYNLILVLLSGIVFGYILHPFLSPKHSENAEYPHIQATGARFSFVESFPLLNPLRECSSFQNLYFDEMLGCKQEIYHFIDSVLVKKPNYEIGFYFKDLVSGYSIGYNEMLKFTPASLMKVTILVALLKEAERDYTILNKRVTITKDMNFPFNNRDEFEFQVGKSYSLEELATIMIRYSDNTAAVLILDKIGLKKVKKVENDMRLGTENPEGIDARVISVRTYSSILKFLYNASYLSSGMSEKALEILCKSNYKNGIRRAIPSNIIVAHKFGIREIELKNSKQKAIEQLHDIALVYRPGKPYLVGIMVKGDNEKVMEEIIYHIAMRTDREIIDRIKMIEDAHIPAEVRE